MRILVTGADGQLGHDVLKRLAAEGEKGIEGAGIGDFNLADFEATERHVKERRPDVVIHCGAYTAVDRAEDERDLCMAVNAGGTEAIARACRSTGAKMIYISTDYVFGGEGETPFETDDETRPLNTYALSKYMGEEAVRRLVEKSFIVRTSWVFGTNGGNFVKTMLRASESRDSVRVVDDQTGSPTYTVDLAALLCEMARTEKYGTYHASNEGFCTWADFTEEIYRLAGRTTRVERITSDQYPSKAKRPRNSRLSKSSLDREGFHRLPRWEDATARFLKELQSI